MRIPSAFCFIIPYIVLDGDDNHTPLNNKDDKQLKQNGIVSHSSCESFELFILLFIYECFSSSVYFTGAISHCSLFQHFLDVKVCFNLIIFLFLFRCIIEGVEGEAIEINAKFKFWAILRSFW